MTFVRINDGRERQLTFYLAMEEYLARNAVDLAKDDLFFIWQVGPTVIFGRNQDIEAEVNISFCRENEIEFFRRKSGGGCVYADRGNVMISYITPNTNVCEVFAGYLDSLSNALCGLGFDAVKTEHNDILISGRKVSGNAFYALPHSSIVHGTLLYDVDFEMMSLAITPSREKLNSHGVKSVRQRVINLKDLAEQRVGGLDGLSIDAVCNHLISSFCDGEFVLGDEDVKKIEVIERDYLDEKFILGRYVNLT